MTPDLDNPLWQLLLIAALMWAVLALLWAHDRLKHRRLARRASLDARTQGADAAVGDPRRRRADTRRGDLRNDHDARAVGAGEARAEDRGVRQVRPVDRRLLVLHRLELSDDELVALARYLDLGFRVTWSEAQVIDLAEAHVKVGASADAILYGERSARR